MPEPNLNYERIMAYRPVDIRVSYGERECILYALGIGMGMDPLDPGELKFVYERAGLEAFPTMAVVLGWPGRMTDPALGIDERLVVAGDLKVTLHRPLAAQATLVSRPRVKEVIDKGRGNAAIRPRPISRSCTASTATRIRCMPTRSVPRPPVSIAPSCTARRASASPRARSCAPARTIGQGGSKASKRGSRGRSFPATSSAPRSGARVSASRSNAASSRATTSC